MYRSSLLRILVFTVLVLVPSSFALKAQDVNLDSLGIDRKYVDTFELLSSLEDEDYDVLKIPSLNVLLDRAVNSPKYTQYNGRIDDELAELTTVRRQWMTWVRFFGTYSYGNSNMAALQYVESSYPIFNYNSTQQQQQFWTVGVNVNIPLESIFNYGNTVRQQKAKVKIARGEREAMLEEIKLNIVKLYADAMKQFELFKVYAENLAAADAQYSIGENDFMNGALNVHELFIYKNYQSGAQLDYSQCKASLNEALLCLEIMTGVPIIRMMKDGMTVEEIEYEEDRKTSIFKNWKNRRDE